MGQIGSIMESGQKVSGNDHLISSYILVVYNEQ